MSTRSRSICHTRSWSITERPSDLHRVTAAYHIAETHENAVEPVDDYHRENPLEPRAWEARVGTEDQEIAEESETAEKERLQKTRDGQSCMTAAVPV
jgi:hypothetical protein